MRGKAEDCRPHSNIIRITPAYAGKSMYQILFDLNTKDHPRLCGEKGMEKKLHICFMGSPPPMRGKVLSHTPITAGRRITPAYAGKSSPRTSAEP